MKFSTVNFALLAGFASLTLSSVSCSFVWECETGYSKVLSKFTRDTEEILEKLFDIYECGQKHRKRFYEPDSKAYRKCINDLGLPDFYDNCISSFSIIDFQNEDSFKKAMKTTASTVCFFLNCARERVLDIDDMEKISFKVSAKKSDLPIQHTILECKTGKSEVLSEFTRDTEAILEKLFDIYNCGQKHMKNLSNPDTKAYRKCIKDLNLPDFYDNETSFFSSFYFDDEDSFKKAMKTTASTVCFYLNGVRERVSDPDDIEEIYYKVGAKKPDLPIQHTSSSSSFMLSGHRSFEQISFFMFSAFIIIVILMLVGLYFLHRRNLDSPSDH